MLKIKYGDVVLTTERLRKSCDESVPSTIKFVEVKAPPRRIVITGETRPDWIPTCQMCSEQFDMWYTNDATWNALPLWLRDWHLCVRCYQVMVEKQLAPDEAALWRLKALGVRGGE